MKKIRLLSILTAAAFLLQCASVAVAAAEIKNTVKAVVDFDNSVVNISGTVANNENILIEVVNPDIDVDMMDTLPAAVQKTMLNHIEMIKAADNKYSISYTIEGTSGLYTVLVRGNSMNKAQETTFNYEDKAEMELRLIELNGYIKTTDNGNIKGFLNTYANKFFNESVFYTKLSDAGKDEVVAKILAAGEATAIKNVKEIVARYSTLQALFEAKENEKIKKNAGEILVEYANELGITGLAEYPFMANEDSAFIAELGRRIGEKRYTSILDFETAYNTAMCLTEISEADNYGVINGVLKRASDAGIISVSSYFSLTSTANVDKKLVKMSYADAASLETAVGSFVAAEGSKGSGGGGGGGSSSSVKINVDISPDALPSLTNTESAFSDVDESHWAHESILALKKHGSVNGYSDGSFKPDNNVLRDEFLKIALESFGIIDDTAECSFKDVTENDWCYKWIATAQTHGIISGDEHGNFNGNSNVTRQDAAKILIGILNFKSNNLPPEREYDGFADYSDIADYALESIITLYRAGAINGYSDGKLLPRAFATRAETTKMIFSVLQKISV